MNEDKIIDEIRENRTKILSEFDFDLDNYMKSLFKKQEDNQLKYINLRSIKDKANYEDVRFIGDLK